jgi:hypothetical protein
MTQTVTFRCSKIGAAQVIEDRPPSPKCRNASVKIEKGMIGLTAQMNDVCKLLAELQEAVKQANVFYVRALEK